MKRKKFNLVVVAHPDDETLFFSGLIQSHAHRDQWEVVCVTDGNADGKGTQRHRQFKRACSELQVQKAHWWRYPDRYETRLPVTTLVAQLQNWTPLPQKIFTHNILGEYGHPHHQDVSWAVHQAFSKKIPVYSTAYNAFPDLHIRLSAADFQRKVKILSKIYKSETQRFSHLLPATSCEGFVQVSLTEVNALYRFLCTGKHPQISQLNVFKWYWNYLKQSPRGATLPRPF